MRTLSEQQDYFLVIPRNQNREIVVAYNPLQRALGPCSLPKITVPRWERKGIGLTRKIQTELDLNSICLFWQRSPRTVNGDDLHLVNPPRSAFLEIRVNGWHPPAGMKWVPVASLESEDFSDETHFEFLQNALKQADDYATGRKAGPFGRPGWLDEVFTWALPYIKPYGLHFTGGFQQYNASANFNLIRLDTNRSSVWLKGANDEGWPEYDITVGLAGRFPQYFPILYAHRPEWRAWLNEGLDSSLYGALQAPHIEATVRTLAGLQTDVAGDIKFLFGVRCKDWRMSRIIEQIAPFMESMTELMEKQEAASPRKLSRQELLDLADILESACRRLATLGIPDTFVHGDFTPGSNVVASDRCLLIDLAEAYVGHPFLCFQYLLDGLHTRFSQFDPFHDYLKSVYASYWQKFASPEVIEEGFRLARLVTVLWHATGGNGWQGRRGYLDLIREKYYRSLVRQMQQRAQELQSQGVACAAS
jgi:hypothetical protein